MSYIVSVDVGGTFTDIILFDQGSKKLHITKTPSTPKDQSVGVIEGLRKICLQAGADAKDVTNILHGTTVATNAVLEGKGARVGLVVTRGYAQILHLARSWTPGPLAGWMVMEKPQPLATIEDTVEIDERIGADGTVIQPLDIKRVAKQLDDLMKNGVSALTVCLMNSYVNNQHERAIKDLLQTNHPDLPITISSEVMPEFREYERTLTTVMNSYVKPKMHHYLSSLEKRLQQHGIAGTLDIIRSDGGVMSAREAGDNPVHTMLSGPSGGVAGATLVGNASGHPNIISFDMGGTSTDVSLTLDGVPRIARETKVGVYPVKSPSVEVVTIGAGGGSIAHVPITGALRVGPQSAGADPGPACYGRGGESATVTDANVVLGYLPPKLVGGEITLDVDAAHQALAGIAESLKLDVYQAAKGVIDIVNENMLGAIRVASLEKGHDPREFALVPLGGAGPMHANALGVLAGSFPVVIPTLPGVLSALGFLASDFRNEFSQTCIMTVEAADAKQMASDLKKLGKKALEWLAKEGVPEAQREITYEVDMRYLRQGFELPIKTTMEEVRTDLGKVVQRFKNEHDRLYGFSLDIEVEVVNLRATAVGRTDRIALTKADGASRKLRDAIVDADHQAYFDGEFVATPVYERARLDIGHRIEGPAIITQIDSTTVLLPRHVAAIDELLNIVIRPVASVLMRRSAMSAKKELDSITVDIIENALRNARHEMDATLYSTALSPVIREQHDEFPMICDAEGKMLVGQFGSYIPGLLRDYDEEIEEGDVIMLSDPYTCGGAISHINDHLILVPIFYQGERIGFSSMFGHLMDVGGPVAGSMPVAAKDIFGEGMRLPPIKIYRRGELNKDIMKLLLNNTRTPVENQSDIQGIIAGCRVGVKRVIDLCERFGLSTYQAACEALLERTRRMMAQLIVQNLPEQPVSFEDYVDDDGLGNGPFKMKLTLWRKGEKAFFDWAGTDPQAPGPINFYLNEEMFKMFIGVYLIMVYDPDILFNDGFYDLLEVRIPEGSLLQPKFPAALGCRTHALARLFDVLGGALVTNAPAFGTAAGYGSSPYFIYSGHRKGNGKYFHLMEILYGGIPGRPIGDGMDGHSWWPEFVNIPNEYLEIYYPLRVERYTSAMDSGGAGLHRGGNGIEKLYTCLEDGLVSIHDDRSRTPPWGINGGLHGQVSRKVLLRKDGTREELPSKIDNVPIKAGDQVLFITAGGGGWGDGLTRPPEQVATDVKRGLISAEKAKGDYGVVLNQDGVLNEAATLKLREQMKAERGDPSAFDFGQRGAA